MLPRSCSLPQMAGGSASALTLSRPAQALRVLRPVGSLSHPEVTFVTRLQPCQLPSRAARQLPDLSTIFRVEPSSTDDSRLRGALPRTVIDLRVTKHGLACGNCSRAAGAERFASVPSRPLRQPDHHRSQALRVRRCGERLTFRKRKSRTALDGVSLPHGPEISPDRRSHS